MSDLAAPAGQQHAVARVIDNNQAGKTAVVVLVCDPPTLEVGTLLYSRPPNHAAELVAAYLAGMSAASTSLEADHD